ncbi:hypothetical protein [uncultured Flavobacterium sp.]|uniref:hypothetical protein n=1 Tax=uncultured Flavobacterium sp. TaxID=165435 RepID=UPI0025D173B1|nr:hypothetical protein [uncultured Flavobacterium sp.]
MEKTRSTSLFGRLFCAFMALYLLNCSVDSPDTQRDGFSDNLAINDQESLLELIIEKVFGYNDAIAEYDDDDSENSSAKKTVSLDLYVFPGTDPAVFAFEASDLKIPQPIAQRIEPADFAILSPPPEA